MSNIKRHITNFKEVVMKFYFWFVSETTTKFREAETNEDGRIVESGS